MQLAALLCYGIFVESKGPLNMRLVAVLLSVFLLAGTPASRELRLAESPWPPYVEDGAESGLSVDLVHTALRRAGYRPVSVAKPIGTLLPALRTGSADGSVALWKSPERERYLLYSDPYLQNRLVVVGRNGTDVTARRLEDLAGKRVAIVADYAYGTALKQTADVNLIEGRNDEDNLRSLLMGEVDYILADEVLVAHLFQRYGDEARRLLTAGKVPLVMRNLHFAIRREFPEAERLVKAFNREILRMEADGSYNRILDLEWIRVDIDGDGRAELVVDGTAAGTKEPEDGYAILEPTQDEEGGSDADEQKKGLERRYVIEGKVYESWDAVPAKYKTAPKRRQLEGKQEGILLFDF
ncbi:MAG: substrate-binding periplasmic protein [Myxococcota bacterium]